MNDAAMIAAGLTALQHLNVGIVAAATVMGEDDDPTDPTKPPPPSCWAVPVVFVATGILCNHAGPCFFENELEIQFPFCVPSLVHSPRGRQRVFCLKHGYLVLISGGHKRLLYSLLFFLLAKTFAFAAHGQVQLCACSFSVFAPHSSNIVSTS